MPPEPTLLDVLKAVQQCQNSLCNLNCQVQGLKEEFIFLRQYVQKIRNEHLLWKAALKNWRTSLSHEAQMLKR